MQSIEISSLLGVLGVLRRGQTVRYREICEKESTGRSRPVTDSGRTSRLMGRNPGTRILVRIPEKPLLLVEYQRLVPGNTS